MVAPLASRSAIAIRSGSDRYRGLRNFGSESFTRRIPDEFPRGIDDRPTVTPPVARLAVDRAKPTCLRVAEPLGDQAHVLLLLSACTPPAGVLRRSRIAT